MRRILVRASLLVSSVASAVALYAGDVVAQDHSWLWPLYTADTPTTTGQPRPAIWGGTGELQKFTQNIADIYMHPGSDIRGDYLDPVIVPVDSTVLRTRRFSDDCVNGNNTSCRVWFQAQTNSGRFLWYVSHIYIGPGPQPGELDVNTDVRAALENATTISAGKRLAVLANFGPGWQHLHIGVFDTQNNYSLLYAPDFLEQEPVGSTGQSLLIVDDEAPTILSLDLVNNGASINGGSAIVNGDCGPEVSGNLDLIADAFDTFYTTGPFNDFPGKSTLNPVTNVRSARYSVMRVSDRAPIANGTWFDHAPTPMTCGSDPNRNCIEQGTNPTITQFLDRMDIETLVPGAPSAGLSVLTGLYDLAASSSNYTTAGGERYFHILTNAGGADGSWNTAGLPNGRYQITAEAFDFSGHGTARSIIVTVHQPNTTLDLTQPGFGDAYMKDNPSDAGAVPSNAGGQPFWESPDIFVVPAGTPKPAVDAAAVQSLVTANTPFDVYVRIRNNGCTAIDGIKVQVLSADPAAINTIWRPITFPQDQFVGDRDHPDGLLVPRDGVDLMGPFTWTPTPEEAQGDGHRCLLAAINALNDPLASADRFNAPDFNNVTQRNLRVSGCSFQLSNPTSSVAQIGLRLVTDAAVESTDVVELSMPFVQSAFDAWAGVVGVNITQSGGLLFVRLRVRDITLPQFSLGPGVVLDLNLGLNLSGSGSRSVRLEPTLNGTAAAGFSCFGQGIAIPA